MASLINKARKPKFDVHLKISDLNNVPLVSGVSMIKWHLPHSIHREHRGQTAKCPILNHRVEYAYSKVIPVRITIDRNNNLSDCPIEFEVLQEFSTGGNAGAAGRDEKITLGTIRLNLSEYVEESEAVLRDGTTAQAIKDALTSPVQKPTHRPNRSSLGNIAPLVAADETSPRSSRDEERPSFDVQDGVVRRYLMQESKINSTLKISILMVQVDGERNYVAPPPKSAPVFGGIAGFVAGDAFEPVDPAANTPGHAPSSFSGKSRDVFELQDMYRRALAASWASQPGELPADQCIEDIFAGGEGFGGGPPKSSHGHGRGHSRRRRTDVRRSTSASDDDEADPSGTLRPRDLARLRRHLRDDNQSVTSDRTVLPSADRDRDLDRDSSRAIGLSNPPPAQGPFPTALREPFPQFPLSSLHRREESKITHDGGGLRSRSSSLVSLAATATTLGERGREGFKRAREVDEFEVRENLVAWSVQGRG